MNEPPTPANYWDTQERIDQVELSPRDALVVSVVSHSGAHYVRLQVHRTETVDGTLRSSAGQKGVILPIDSVAAVAALLTQTVERRTTSVYEQRPIVAEEEDDPFA